MKLLSVFFSFLIFISSDLRAQNADAFALRHKVFGAYERNTDVGHYVFDLSVLVVFSNGNTITKEEFQHFYDKQPHDTTLASRTDKLNVLIDLRQKTFEGMAQNLDTAAAFKREFLGYRTQLLHPYVFKGDSEEEAEAVAGMNFEMRSYYSGILAFEVMNREVWSKAVKDTAAQRILYTADPAKYDNQPFSKVKNKVVIDYQKDLEKLLSIRLDNAYKFRINEALLKSL